MTAGHDHPRHQLLNWPSRHPRGSIRGEPRQPRRESVPRGTRGSADTSPGPAHRAAPRRDPTERSDTPDARRNAIPSSRPRRQPGRRSWRGRTSCSSAPTTSRVGRPRTKPWQRGWTPAPALPTSRQEESSLAGGPPWPRRLRLPPPGVRRQAAGSSIAMQAPPRALSP